jgi:hypothetical protein
MTSGEVTHRLLASRPTPEWQELGTNGLHITEAVCGAGDIFGLNLEVVTDPERANFFLAHGTDGIGQRDGSARRQSIAQLQDLLPQCSRASTCPMVVAIPDVVTVSGCVFSARDVCHCV